MKSPRMKGGTMGNVYGKRKTISKGADQYHHAKQKGRGEKVALWSADRALTMGLDQHHQKDQVEKKH